MIYIDDHLFTIEIFDFSAQNIHTESDWDIIFTLLECVGAGAIPADYEESLTLTQAYQGKICSNYI